MSITLEECIKMLNSYAKSARNIAKDCLNKDGRHKLIKTAEKYEQEAEWLKELKAVKDLIKQHDEDSMPEDFWYIDKIREAVQE
jgi:uncharacterized protein Yka (UPF0111/DUF47 family)